MNELLNTTESVSTLSLCYLDEIDQYLKEIDESTYFAVAPLSVTYKRLYLIGDYIYKGTVTVSATLPVDFSSDYEIRLKLGSVYTDASDFENYSNSVSGNFEQLGFKYGNAIPLDVMIYSNTITETHTSINFTLEWDENIDNCLNPSFIRLQQIVQDSLLPATTVVTFKMSGDVISTRTLTEDTYISDVITYFRNTTMLELMALSVNGEYITCNWDYEECISIYDNNNVFKIELKGTETLPQ